MITKLVGQWEKIQSNLERLHSAAEVRPRNSNEVFRPGEPATEGAVAIELGPVVFNVPERADDNNIDLYVVVRGRFSFCKENYTTDQTLKTWDFATEVAYFRRSHDELIHVFGAHYDCAVDEVGHPTFHAQMKSFHEFSQYVRQQYPIKVQDLPKDRISGILKTVRLPTAQMDVFSTVLQICADHLVSKRSGPEVRQAFNKLVEANAFCIGAGYRAPRLARDEAQECYRARHWYPLVN